MKELRAAIKLLEAEVSYKDLLLKQNISDIKESMHPANILAAAFNKLTGGESFHFERRHSFSGGINLVKTGLALWLRKLLFKAEDKVEQNVYDAIDNAFDHVRDFLKKKV